MEDVYRLYKSMKIIYNYINGKLSKPENSNYIKVFNPSLGKVYAKCPDSSSIDLNNAISSANKAFISWSKKSNEERSEILLKIAHELHKNREKFASINIENTIQNRTP